MIVPRTVRFRTVFFSNYRRRIDVSTEEDRKRVSMLHSYSRRENEVLCQQDETNNLEEIAYLFPLEDFTLTNNPKPREKNN